MNKRIARKILNRNGDYWYWSYVRLCDGGLFGSLWPKNFGLYHKACNVLKRKLYYDKLWYKRHKAKEITKNMTKEEFYKKVMTGIEGLPAEWRKGQKVFNYIEANYHIARTLQFEKGVDCFYNDTKIEEFINCVYDLLEETK